MKINILNNSSAKLNCPITKELIVQLQKFAAENKVSDHLIDIWSDSKGRQLFCDWLNENQILKIKPWEFVLSDERIIGQGFEIDDVSLTMFMLKSNDNTEHV